MTYAGRYKSPRPHPLTPSPAGEGELNLLLPSPGGRGAGGEGETLQISGFHVNLTPMGTAMPLKLSVPHNLQSAVNCCCGKAIALLELGCNCDRTLK
ncbi:hypothetical protein NIES37_66490 [Tolypothrix tenuis PCC 7101]|uniref:Uncharacterized protein n=1 Tax=Tolypothrix tenuis PCC 7101 TaxID=231146 RepID=A0A1Z4NAC6_9CYAN|nr:hypothetical protein NIES37_66490 [Tolypothrix tenuis PCC 7101]BAZ73443.1 hypothetical protein NIES50_20080 [Aulosira laxa NIES-50]